MTNGYNWIYGQPMIPELLDDEPLPKLNSSIKAVKRRLGIEFMSDFFIEAYSECHALPFDLVRAVNDSDNYKSKGTIPQYVKDFCEENS